MFEKKILKIIYYNNCENFHLQKMCAGTIVVFEQIIRELLTVYQ